MSTAGYFPLPTDTDLVRIHRLVEDVLWFGRGRNRFGAPDDSYGICYLACKEEGAFVETFLRDPDATSSGPRILAASELEARFCTPVKTRRELVLAQLHGNGLAWWHSTASVSSSDGYRESRALALHIHGMGTDGIAYRCRHDNDQIAVAIFDRAASALSADGASGVVPCLDLARRLDGRYPFVIDPDA